MADLKLFRIEQGQAVELVGGSLGLEKPLQRLIERNMEALFGVRLVATEHWTGHQHGGRIDSLGIDEDGSPVILEYKRSVNENVINQGLFYLDWLLDHKADFQLLVMQRGWPELAAKIDWTSPRLICVASDFTRYDQHAVAQIDRAIELVRYRDYDGKYLSLELVASTTVGKSHVPVGDPLPKSPHKTVSQLYEQASPDLRELYDSLSAYLLALGDDITSTARRDYFAFRRLTNFACVEVHPQSKRLLVYVKVDPTSVTLEEGFTRDVTKIGHFGTGNLEITLARLPDLERAYPLLQTSYAAS